MIDQGLLRRRGLLEEWYCYPDTDGQRPVTRVVLAVFQEGSRILYLRYGISTVRRDDGDEVCCAISQLAEQANDLLTAASA